MLTTKEMTAGEIDDIKVELALNALCIFEAALADKGLYEWMAVDEHDQEGGVACVRTNSLGLSELIERAYQEAKEVYHYDTCFDFQFVPFVLVWLQERTDSCHGVNVDLAISAGLAAGRDYVNDPV